MKTDYLFLKRTMLDCKGLNKAREHAVGSRDLTYIPRFTASSNSSSMAGLQPLLQRQPHPFPVHDKLSDERLQDKGW